MGVRGAAEHATSSRSLSPYQTPALLQLTPVFERQKRDLQSNLRRALDQSVSGVGVSSSCKQTHKSPNNIRILPTVLLHNPAHEIHRHAHLSSAYQTTRECSVSQWRVCTAIVMATARFLLGFISWVLIGILEWFAGDVELTHLLVGSAHPTLNYGLAFQRENALFRIPEKSAPTTAHGSTSIHLDATPKAWMTGSHQLTGGAQTQTSRHCHLLWSYQALGHKKQTRVAE